MKLRSLTGRIALLMGAAVVLILGAAALLMDHLVDASMSGRFDANLVSQARSLADLVDADPDDLVAGRSRSVHAHLFGGEAPTRYAIDCADGGRLRSDPPPGAAPPHWARRAVPEPTFADLNTDGKAQRAVWFTFWTGDTSTVTRAPAKDDSHQRTRCSVLLMQPRAELDDILTAVDGIVLVTPMLALLAVLMLSPLLVRRGLKPLTALGDKMRDVGPQTPGRRLHATGTRELEPLVTRFNEVLVRMDEGVARERQFAAALAHETRTRLAELRSLVEVEQRFPSGRPTLELMAEVGAIGGDLEDTVAGVLLLTRLDAGIEEIERGAVDIDALVAEHVGTLSEALQQRNLRLDVPRQVEPLSLQADPDLLAIIVRNLLANAVAYAARDSVVVVERDAEVLTIVNAAPELEADDVRQLGQRFWSKHGHDAGHAGIGLALAGAAASAMGMRLTFALAANHELRASLYWLSD